MIWSIFSIDKDLYTEDIMNEDIRVRIGQQIADLRNENKMTQQQLADKIGITRVHLSRIESGRYSAGVDIVSRLSNALGAQLEIIKKGKS